MRRLSILGLILFLASSALAAERPAVAGRNGGVSAGHPLTTSAAMEILQQGDDKPTGDWPQFRGRNVDGIASDKVFDRSRPIGLELGWRARLGSGYSGVSVQNGLAVTMFDDGEFNVIAAFDALTGRERWRFPVSPTHLGRDGSYDGPISTPLIYDNLTIALGPFGRLVALDNQDGELVWSTDLVSDHEAVLPLYGFATSPIVENGTVVLQIGREGGAIAGFDPATGERRWIAGSDVVDYQNAVPVTRDGHRYVLASGHEAIMGVDPVSGDVLWRYEHGGGMSRPLLNLVG